MNLAQCYSLILASQIKGMNEDCAEQSSFESAVIQKLYKKSESNTSKENIQAIIHIFWYMILNFQIMRH